MVEKNLEARETQPPPRFGQGQLIELMEKHNLGTKATRHAIIGDHDRVTVAADEHVVRWHADLDGELRVGDETHVLEEGDTFTYSPRDPHTWRNPSESEEAVVLWTALPNPYSV